MLFKNIPKKCIIRDFVLTIVWSVINVAYVRLLSLMTTQYASENPAWYVILAYFSFILMWEITEYFADIYQEISVSYIESNVRLWTLKEIYELKPSVIKQYNTGYINGVINKYINTNINAYCNVILFAPLALIYIGYCIIQLSRYNVIYGLTLFVTFVVSVILKMVFSPEKRDKEVTKVEGERDKFFIDSISNINTVQKMQAFDFIKGKGEASKKECLTAVFKWAVVKEIGFSGYKLLSYAYLPVALILVHLYPETVENRVEFFSFLAVVCIQFVHNSKSIADTLIKVSRFRASKAKLLEIIKEENKRQELLVLDEFRNAQIMNVTYQYQDKSRDRAVIVDIPFFQLTKGDKICLYGESGQGKSTLLNILSGEIETDGVVINGQPEKRRLDCVFISQDTEILDMTLRDNLTLGNTTITDEQIIKMLESSGLSEWYSKQPDGLDTMLGERGVFVSSGQRQRLNIIRGLLRRDKEIYLLDEPTSNVDEETEGRLIAMIEDYLRDKTMVVVTHRPAIKQICNKAYKFVDGKLQPMEKLS